MADRTVKVSLIAQVNGYVSEMRKAQQATKETSDDAVQQTAKQQAALQAMGVQGGIAIGALGAIAAAGVVLAIKKFADFDAQMSQVQAVSGATASQMDDLSAAALSAGRDIGFSANQAADAETELAKAGISVKDILGGALPGALNLAAAGQIDVSQATQIATVALTQFGLAGKDVPHIADLLAAGADKALGGVDQLGQALNQSGQVSAQFGVSLDETVGTLSAFANAGLLGSDAGTSFKTMLLALSKPSAQAQQLMDKLGIAAFDAQGKFVGIDGLAGQLQKSLGGLTDAQRQSALATIFGTDAIRSASVLYKEGSSGIDKWTKSVNDNGFAAEQAQKKMDNLNGDVTKLGAAFDSAFIKGGSAANGVLRDLVQSVTGLVSGFVDLPPIVQQSAFVMAALAAAVTLTGAGALLAVPKFLQFADALRTLAASDIPGVATAANAMLTATNRAGSALAATAKFLTGPWGVALAAAVVGVDLLSKYLDSLQASSTEITNSLKSASNAAEIFQTASKGKDIKFFSDVKADLKDLPAVLQASADQSKNLFARFDSTHFGAFDALKQIGTQLGTLAENDLPSAQHAFSLLAAQTDGSEKELNRLLETMPDYKQALIDQATAQGINVTSSDEAANKQKLLKLAQEQTNSSTQRQADVLAVLGQNADTTKDSVDNLSGAIRDFGKPAFDTERAAVAFNQALSDMANVLGTGDDGSVNGSLDITTQKGRDTAQTFLDMASSTNDYAAALVAQGAPQAEVQSTLDAGRQKIIDTRVALGDSKQAATDYANQLIATPKDVATAVTLSGVDTAQAKMDAFVRNNDGRVVHMNVDITGRGTAFVPGLGNIGFAAGGAVRGPGTATSDSVFARLSAGEHVLTAAEVQAMGGQEGVYRFRAGLRGFADGGAVTPTYVSAPSRYAGGSSSAGATQVKVIVQPKGGIDILKYIDFSIQQADRAAEITTVGRPR